MKTSKSKVGEKHELKTIADIIKVITPENIDNFLTDFRGFLALNLNIKIAQDIFGEQNVSIKKDKEGVMTWIDDGKTDAHINLQITP